MVGHFLYASRMLLECVKVVHNVFGLTWDVALIRNLYKIAIFDIFHAVDGFLAGMCCIGCYTS